MADQPNRERKRYAFLVEDAGGTDAVPVAHRLRSWLKCGLRAFGLKCIRAEERPARVVPARKEVTPP